MHILILQHARVEHPGALRPLLKRDGHETTTIHLDEGETLPSLDGFDALWVLGGPMDVWEDDLYPWLRAEKKIIREAVVDKNLPFLGLCLGHQLLAEALGGSCGKSDVSEVGIMDVDLTDEGRKSPFTSDLPTRFKCLQWHGAEVKKLPENAVNLASSPACKLQAMSWGNRALSAQFHVEVELDTVRNWSKIPAYNQSLEAALGAQGASTLEDQIASRIASFNRLAGSFYDKWHNLVRNPETIGAE